MKYLIIGILPLAGMTINSESTSEYLINLLTMALIIGSLIILIVDKNSHIDKPHHRHKHGFH